MINLIERVRCYLLRCYLGDIDADLRGGLEELSWTRNPTEGKLKVGLAETKKNPAKRKVFWGFAEYENLTFLELLYVLHEKSCETQWKKHYMQVMEGNKKPFLPKYSVFCTKGTISQKNNLF